MIHNKTGKIAILMGVFIVLILIASFGGYYGRHFWTKTFGLDLKPSQVIAPKVVEVNLQNDSRWSEDLLGNSRYSMGGYGCLVSVLATSITDLGYKINAGDLNRKFSEYGIFTNQGEVIWYKISEVFPDVRYRYQRIFNSGTFENDLREGKLPIVMVKYNKTGVFHWVLIVGADENDFLIVDPLNGSKDYMRLSKHGNVYAYRVLEKQNE